jgi:serine protease inhibitor
VDTLGYRPVELELPRFKVEIGVRSLKKTLAEMGMTEAFGATADFARMTDGEVYIDDVLHKALIEVNEDNTVAAVCVYVCECVCVCACACVCM